MNPFEKEKEEEDSSAPSPIGLSKEYSHK